MGLQLQSIGFKRFSDAELIAYADAGEHVHGLGHLYNGSVSLAYGLTDNLTLIASLPYVSRRDQREATHPHAGEDDHHDDPVLPLPALPGPSTQIPSLPDSPLPIHALPAIRSAVTASTTTRANHTVPGLPPTHEDASTVQALGAASGMGDLSMLAQYRWYQDETTGRQVAWLLGLKAPTGRTDVRDDAGRRLESHHQPGSGAWDGLLGLAMTQAGYSGTWDANLLYSHRGKGSQDTRLGHGLAYNLGYSRRLGGTDSGAEEPHEHDHGHGHSHAVPGRIGSMIRALTWDAMLELNGEWRDHEQQSGRRVDNSGGHLLYLAPGLRLGLGEWSAGLSLGIPVVVDLEGTQSEPDYRLLFSVATMM